MSDPFIFLSSEITRDHALALVRWLEDEQVTRYLSETQDVSQEIAHVLERVHLPILTHLFQQKGRFFIVHTRQHHPIGFVRLIPGASETEIVLAIGERAQWGKRLGTATIRESLKIAFFEMRSPRVIAKIHKENRRSLRVFLRAGFQQERETDSLRCFALTLPEYLAQSRRRPVRCDEIYLTALDKDRLSRLLARFSPAGQDAPADLATLEQELNRATIVEATELSPSIVTMRSRVLLELDDEPMDVSLVYPHEAAQDSGRLSVLSPVGTAILGYAEGAELHWELPAGQASIRIKKVLYQPEAAGDYGL